MALGAGLTDGHTVVAEMSCVMSAECDIAAGNGGTQRTGFTGGDRPHKCRRRHSPTLPCCRDRLGEQSCQALRRTHPSQFEKRCLNDHDFHTLGCCAECRSYIKLHSIQPENSKSLLKAPIICRDKHSLSFCRRFKASGMGKYSCGDAQFAVRVCRHTCGYCNDALYEEKNIAPLCAANVITSTLGPNYAFLRNRLH
ncbi:hypothetical protein GCK32_005811 [Trichostrongylus colubriformis]|uniref:Uncharacterized protein n=1 Tax=Trichostrongylus colubriformis TaxID=6319 RepID=A0AAN8IT74_TRICO